MASSNGLSARVTKKLFRKLWLAGKKCLKRKQANCAGAVACAAEIIGEIFS
jgi:hypothetical protein